MIVKASDPYSVELTMSRDEALVLHNALLSLRLNAVGQQVYNGVDLEYLRGQLSGIADGS